MTADFSLLDNAAFILHLNGHYNTLFYQKRNINHATVRNVNNKRFYLPLF